MALTISKPKAKKPEVKKTIVMKGKPSTQSKALVTLATERVSLFHKLRMMLVSVIESGNMQEEKKMRSYLRGVLQPDKTDKCQNNLRTLSNLFDAYTESGDAKLVTDVLDDTMKYLETKK
ncbi:coil containing protein [Vibrio phage V-YDF132]|nr:coil containing protein [Vibrio phage V-YDF132]